MRISSLSTGVLVLVAHASHVSAQFKQNQENDYLARFGKINSASYAAVDDSESNVPPTLLPACKDSPSVVEPSEVTISSTTSTITASSVASQCDASTICTIPAGVTLEMDRNLNVAALVVRGAVLWTDATQMSNNELGMYICAGYIAVEALGSWYMNLQEKEGWIYLKNNGMAHATLRSRSFGGVGAGSRVEVIGRNMKRTWSLLSDVLKVGSSYMKLLHDPRLMDWMVGDRIAIAPTEKNSAGWGQDFRIESIGEDGIVKLDRPANYEFKATFKVTTSDEKLVATMSAEVVNMKRNIVITGDDFSHVDAADGMEEAFPGEGTSVSGCLKNNFRSKCTYGLHTAQMLGGVMKIVNTRVEKCGQRGVEGKYCLHFHKLGECPDCLFQNNAIESSQQRGIIVHGTHLTTVENNVLYNVRGANVYTEDGNEMHNKIKYNVVICPFPFDDEILGGCTIPGTSNSIADTSDNQAAFYSRAHTNDMIGNRAANTFNGMFNQALGMGRGVQNNGKVCEADARLGRFDGNVFHGHKRFGTYTLGNNYPKVTDQNTSTNGHNTNLAFCSGFDDNGSTRGAPGTFNNHLDYDNVFVGHYMAGDYQYQGHFSHNNLNLLYWKETKNMEDGCSAHIKNGHYEEGNLALPDQASFIIEDTHLVNAVLEANHHCTVGQTGLLCMPQYILHNVKFQASGMLSRWLYFNNHVRGDHNYIQNDGGIFSLSPRDAKIVMEGGHLEASIFPDGYVSAISSNFEYLLSHPNNVCDRASILGTSMEKRYDSGILCRVPLRALKVYSRGLTTQMKPYDLKVEAWFNDSRESNPHAVQNIRYHQSGPDGTKRQGYSIPIIPGLANRYRLSLGNGSNIPADWVIEFSDPIMGNKYDVEQIILEVPGRNCANGGLVTSQHDRRFIWSGDEFLLDDVWGKHGACVAGPQPNEMPRINCNSSEKMEGKVELLQCPEFCSDSCGQNGYCDCGLKECQCNAGFGGEDCSIDVCDASRCGEHGHCSSRYLGTSSLVLPVTSDKACICDEGWSGTSCERKNPCLEEEKSCNGHGLCISDGSNAICECDDGYSGENCEKSCDGFCPGCGGEYPFCCARDLPGIVKYGCSASGGCSYLNKGEEDFDPEVYCTYKEVRSEESCNCPNSNQCSVVGQCDENNDCPEPTPLPNGTPCQSVPWGVCDNGICQPSSQTTSPTKPRESVKNPSAKPSRIFSSPPSISYSMVPIAAPQKITSSAPTKKESCSTSSDCSNRGTCVIDSDGGGTCNCDDGYSGDKCEASCDGFCMGCGGVFPYCCTTGDLPGIVKYGCNASGGCKYLREDEEDFDSTQFCTYKESHDVVKRKKRGRLRNM